MTGSDAAPAQTNHSQNCLEGRLNIISYQPLVIDFPEFLTLAECRALICAAMRCAGDSAAYQSAHENFHIDPTDKRLLPGEVAALQKVLTHVERLLDTPAHSGEVPPRCGFTPCSGGEGRTLPLGLHVDSNRKERRFATAIVYLATLLPKADGATVFPCAKASPESAAAREAAVRLLAEGCAHTLDVAGDFHGRSQVVDVLNRSAFGDCGLSLAPVAGRLCVFFTRDHNGVVDAASFHGGAGVRCEPPASHKGLPIGKWSLQVFKEVPRRIACDARSIEAYSAERWRHVVSRNHKSRSHTSRQHC